jgi:hypothetical protein
VQNVSHDIFRSAISDKPSIVLAFVLTVTAGAWYWRFNIEMGSRLAAPARGGVRVIEW